MSRWFDMAGIAYDDLCGRPPGAMRVFRERVSWAFLAKDAHSSFRMWREGDMTLRRFLGPYRAPRRVPAVWDARDPAPVLGLAKYLSRKL
jgi:predicted ATP-grasp superfamily ATP-dependent carboligase